MNFTEQNLVYWNLVKELIATYEYQIVQIDQRGEVWLQSPESINATLIRLRRQDIDWANWIKQDFDFTKKQIKQVKRSQFGSKGKALNVYVSTYPPVDSWEHMVESEQKIDTILIDTENRDEQVKKLFQLLDLPLPSYKLWIEGNDETVVTLRDDVYQLRETQNQQMRQVFSNGKPFMTYIFIAINIMMFGLLELAGGSENPAVLIQYGAKYNPSILDGEWWRLITPVFLHIGFLHLFMNTLALYYLGTAVERIYGSVRFTLIYLTAGFAGAVVSFALHAQLSAGASGAIFGLFGSLLYFGVLRPQLFFRTMGMNVIVVLAINLVFGFVVPVVDNSAHIGGLVGGFLASAIVQMPQVRKVARSTLVLIVTAGLGIGIVWYGYNFPVQAQDPITVSLRMQQLFEEERFEQAYKEIVYFMDENDDVPAEIYFWRGVTEYELQMFTDSRKHFEQAIEKRDDFHEAYYNLSLIYKQMNNIESAKKMAQTALQLAPDNSLYERLVDELNRSQ
ncbi:rhomboid family intramembrane serine protease [Bacillus solimangrovi]|uniref:Peptidase S54 rhomboid domain-containing protein n=1 Tax=Bacillus solimangrovi TaxID=1305675 RepID=A0A1E5LFQ8_9BACI|nr:rhomboid family intramembrane serine protease [Bacillus solimangrovi]OEH92900.1 hypothetical protein BFG57_14595 [Bacillus solimangrovi]